MRGRCLRRRLAVVGRHRAVFDLRALQLRAVLVHELHRVLVHCAVELRGVGRVARDGDDLFIPPLECVGVLGVRRLGRGIAVVGRRRAVGDVLVRLQHRAVGVLPRDRVGVHRLRIGRGVGHITGDLDDLGRPLVKRVGVLGVRRLGRGRASVARHRAVGDALVDLECCAVLVHPVDSVAAERLGEYCGVDHLTGDRADLRIPAGEFIGVLRGGCLRRRLAVIARRRAVLDILIRLKHFIAVLPCDRVLVQDLLERRGIGRVARDRCRFGIPAREDVAVLSVARFAGNLRAKRRGRAVVKRILAKHSAVVVLPRNRVLIHRLLERCGINHVAGDSADRRRPAGEGVAVLCVARLGRGFAVIHRRFAVGDVLVRLQNSVSVLPRDRVLVHSAVELRGVGCIAGDGNDFRIPTLERVGVLRRGGLGSIRVRRNCAVFHLGRINYGAVIALPRDRVLIHRPRELRGVGYVAGSGNDLRHPAGECVAVLRVARLGRISVCRNLSVFDFGRVDRAAIIVLPRDDDHSAFLDSDARCRRGIVFVGFLVPHQVGAGREMIHRHVRNRCVSGGTGHLNLHIGRKTGDGAVGLSLIGLTGRCQSSRCGLSGLRNREVCRGFAAFVVIGLGNDRLNCVLARIGRDVRAEFCAALGRVGIGHIAVVGVAGHGRGIGRLAVGPALNRDARMDGSFANLEFRCRFAAQIVCGLSDRRLHDVTANLGWDVRAELRGAFDRVSVGHIAVAGIAGHDGHLGALAVGPILERNRRVDRGPHDVEGQLLGAGVTFAWLCIDCHSSGADVRILTPGERIVRTVDKRGFAIRNHRQWLQLAAGIGLVVDRAEGALSDVLLIFMIVLRIIPFITGGAVIEGCSGCRSRGFGIGAIAIAEPRRITIYRYSCNACVALRSLLRCCRGGRGCRQHYFAASLTTGDICTTCSRVQLSGNC